MKKLFLLILLVIFTITCTACNQEEKEQLKVDKYEGKSGKATCIKQTNIQGFDLKGTYNITYENGYVTEVYTREVVNIDSEDAIKTYLDRIKEDYKKYDELEYFEYSITTSSGKVTNNTFIDYKNLDLDKFSNLSGEVIGREDLRLSKILASYKILGAKCEE